MKLNRRTSKAYHNFLDACEATVTVILAVALVLSLVYTMESVASPLLLLKDQQITKNVTGSPDDDGTVTGCVVQAQSDDWVVQGFTQSFSSCTEACAIWVVSVQKQEVRTEHQEGCQAGQQEKRIENEALLTFDIINTLESSEVSFPIGGTATNSVTTTRENGRVEQSSRIYLEAPTGVQVAGRTFDLVTGSSKESLVTTYVRNEFPITTVGFNVPVWKKDVTVVAGGLIGEVALRVNANDYASSTQFNDIASLLEFPLFPDRSESTTRLQALISVSNSDGISPAAPDTDGDYWVNQLDNCTEVENTDQRDPDGDGYGAICDGDFDNNGVVDTAMDQSILQGALWSVLGDPNYNPDVDMDGDGDVDSADVSIWRDYIGLPPGPSGRVQ